MKKEAKGEKIQIYISPGIIIISTNDKYMNKEIKRKIQLESSPQKRLIGKEMYALEP